MSAALAAAGTLAAALAAAAAITLGPGRRRSAAMLAAITLVPILILGDQWHSHRIVDLRHHPLHILAAAIVAALVLLVLTASFRRWSRALPLLIVGTLAFRVPLEAGGESANLLVPLYLVIAAGALAATIRDSRPAPRTAAPPLARESSQPTAARWLAGTLAVVVVLYAIQTLYSADFSKGLQNVCFFFVPFSVAYALLTDFEWNRKLLVSVVWLLGIEAVLFVLVGSVEYATRGLFWNPQVIRSNEFHTYFRVNSVFWDPNIYGRYLALVTVVVMAALLWVKERRTIAALSALVAVLWLGLVPTFSQSSFVALLAGLAVLAALRWSLRVTIGVVAVGAVVAVAFVAFVGGSSKINFSRLNVDTSGRAHLVSGGIRLFDQRPVLGYGSGSFSTAYRRHVATHRVPVSVSHTEPITVAAEQGLVGLSAYLALLFTALWTMSTGLGALSPGMRRGPRHSQSRADPTQLAARAAVLAAFCALLVHTVAYAAFFEDPITWVLLALGVALARAQVRAPT